MVHIFSVLVEDKFGVLSRVAGLFSSRGYNIKTLCVGKSEEDNCSRITLTVEGDEKTLEQVKKQLNKLIDTIKVLDLMETEHIEREFCFVKIKPQENKKVEALQLGEIFKAKVADISDSEKTITFEITGNVSKIDAFINICKNYNIKKIVRTGTVAIERG